MNSKSVAIILLVVCLGLGGGLYYRHAKATEEKNADSTVIQDLSNQVSSASVAIKDLKVVNEELNRELDTRVDQIKVYSNNLAAVTANLAKTESEAKAAAEASKAEMLKRDAKIAELEAERDDLSKRMATLNSSINSLEAKIGDTQKKLEASEGDRDFLLNELKRLQAEKSELERQFNDLALLREQVRKLRDELSIARRLEWIRRGLYGSVMKGGERLQKGFAAVAPQTNYNLNVELNRDGTVRVTGPSTNSSAAGPNGSAVK
jgi:chromosome segregation ATPase